MDSYPFEDGAARGWQFAKRFFDVESPLLFRREESEGPNIGARVIFELTSNYSIYNVPIAAGKAAQASADQREAAYAKAVKAYQDQIAAREAAYIKAVLGK